MDGIPSTNDVYKRMVVITKQVQVNTSIDFFPLFPKCSKKMKATYLDEDLPY